MSSGVYTVQQILTGAGKEVRKTGLRKSIPPRLSTALDPVTSIILSKAGEKPVTTGAELAGAVLLDTSLNCTAEGAYGVACWLASPLVCRYPLLESLDVDLPSKPPAMWEAEFRLTEIGKLVGQGLLPHCLINGHISRESRMPPIRAKALGEAMQILCSGAGENNIDALLSEVDFACPCLVDDRAGMTWASSGKGNLICQSGATLVGNEVHINTIPCDIGQETAVEKVCELLEDVPGVENCEARAEVLPVQWYKVVVSCKNEVAAKACLEAILASNPLRSKFKIIYTVSDSDNNRTHSSPHEILRCYVSTLSSNGADPSSCARKLAEIDSGGRSAKKIRGGNESMGVQVIWVIDSSGRNKVLPLSTIKKQSRGGKGGKISGSDIKALVTGRARQRGVIFGGNGTMAILDIRAPDSSDTFLHPAESLPEGVSGIVSGICPDNSKYVLIVTSQGLVKKVDRAEMAGGRRGTKVGIKTSGGDSVVGLCSAEEEDELVLVSALGYATRFKVKQLRSMGMGAKGVIGMSVKDGDRLVSCVQIDQGRDGVFLCASDGSGKAVKTEEIPLQNRGGVGHKVIEMNEGVRVTGATKWGASLEILLGSRSGKLIRFSGDELKPTQKDSGNVNLIEIEADDAVVCSVAIDIGGADGQNIGEGVLAPDCISSDGDEIETEASRPTAQDFTESVTPDA